jgi:hypothetical protein
MLWLGSTAAQWQPESKRRCRRSTSIQQMYFQKEMIASTLPVCFYVLLEA